MKRLSINNFRLTHISHTFDFAINKNAFGLFISQNNHQKFYDFRAVLLGAKMPWTGEILIDNIDLVTSNYFYQKKILIEPRFGLWVPLRLALAWRLSCNKQFYFTAKKRLLMSKFDEQAVTKFGKGNSALMRFYHHLDALTTQYLRHIEKQMEQKINFCWTYQQQVKAFWHNVAFDHFGANSVLTIIRMWNIKILLMQKQAHLKILQVVANTFQNINITDIFSLNHSQQQEKLQLSLFQITDCVIEKYQNIIQNQILFTFSRAVVWKRLFQKEKKKVLRKMTFGWLEADFKKMFDQHQQPLGTIFRKWKLTMQQQTTAIHDQLVLFINNDLKRAFHEWSHNISHFYQKFLSTTTNDAQEPATIVKTPVTVFFQALHLVDQLLPQLNLKWSAFTLTKKGSLFSVVVRDLLYAYLLKHEVLLVQNFLLTLTRRQIKTIKMLLFQLQQRGWHFFLFDLEFFKKQRKINYFLASDNYWWNENYNLSYVNRY